MTLATDLAYTPRPGRPMAVQPSTGLGLDIVLVAAAVGVCMLLLFQGGLETLVATLVGAALGLRSGKAMAYAFAGLFIGALFAAFFHSALIAALSAFF